MTVRDDTHIVVVGLGYVGLPLALALARRFHVTGLDINDQRIAELKSHIDRTDEVTEDDFADEHSLNEQRVYNMLCWVYGSDPDKYGSMVDDELLPAARAERCEGEYRQLDRSWSRLLDDHVRE